MKKILFAYYCIIATLQLNAQIKKDIQVVVRDVVEYTYIIDGQEFEEKRRHLFVINGQGETLDSIKIARNIDTYPSCDALLFDLDYWFLFVECNGWWYHISKYSGMVIGGEWNFEQEPPGKYLGTFYYSYTEGRYIFKKTGVVNFKYIKDPCDYSLRFEPFLYPEYYRSKQIRED